LCMDPAFKSELSGLSGYPGLVFDFNSIIRCWWVGWVWKLWRMRVRAAGVRSGGGIVMI